MRRLSSIAVIAAVLSIVSTVPAMADASAAGHVDANAGATKQYDVAGPDRPGVAWTTDLDVDLRNTAEEPLVVDDAGRTFVQGRITNSGDTSLDNRGYLQAIDTSDGSTVWSDPTLDIDWHCGVVATDDGRVIAQRTARPPDDPDNFNSVLVAIDAATGALKGGGQSYSPPETAAEPRLNACPSRLVLVGDLVLIPFGGSASGVRAVDISSTPWTQAWYLPMKTAADTDVGAGRLDQVVVNAAGDTAYYVSAKDLTSNPRTWWVSAIDLTTGMVRSQVEIPGATPINVGTLIAVDGGALVSMLDCGPGTGNTPDCVTRVSDNGTDLSIDWTVMPVDADGDPATLRSLTATGTGVVAGWTSDGIYGLDLSNGSVVFRHKTSSFSNNGNQLIADMDGTLYNGAFGGNYLEAFGPDGHDRFAVPGCATSSDTLELHEPSALGGIAPDGTLVIGNEQATQYDSSGSEIGRTYAVVGVRASAELPKGSCPESDERVSGASRVETSVEISGVSFPQQDSADTVVVATSTNYPDALAGGPLARKLDAPLLLTEPNALNPATKAEIVRLGASHAVLLGGTAALSGAVESELTSMGLTTERIAGNNRFDTAAQIAARVPATTVYVTEGANPDPNRGWPDAVAVSGLASFEQRPILLVIRDAVPAETAQAMTDLGVTDAVVVGGEAAVSASTAAALADPDGDGAAQVTVGREFGASRFATSVAVAQRSVAAGASTLDLWFATGLAFPDALAAGPAVARSGGVLVLVHGTDVNGGPEVYSWLQGLDRDRTLRAWLVGGTNAITDAVATKLVTAAGIN